MSVFVKCFVNFIVILLNKYNNFLYVTGKKNSNFILPKSLRRMFMKKSIYVSNNCYVSYK